MIPAASVLGFRASLRGEAKTLVPVKSISTLVLIGAIMGLGIYGCSGGGHPRLLSPTPVQARSEYASLANQINDCPMLIPSLEMLNGQPNKLGSPQAAGQKQSEHGAISFSPNQVCIGSL
jgi:hypothetical protein